MSDSSRPAIDIRIDPLDLMKIESTHSKINKEDVDVQLSIEKRDSPANPEASAKEILSFEPGDPDNPHNWSNVNASYSKPIVSMITVHRVESRG